jgi:hypothetical protein
MRYLFDFVWSFWLLFRPLFDIMGGGLVALGIFVAVAWASIPHLTRRVM